MTSGLGICIVEGCSGVLFRGIDVFEFDGVPHGKCSKVLLLRSSEPVLEARCSFGGEKFVTIKPHFGHFLGAFGFSLSSFGGEPYATFSTERSRNALSFSRLL